MNSPEKLSSAGTTPNKQVRGADRPSDHRGWPPEQPWLKVRTGVAKSPDTCGSHAGIYNIFLDCLFQLLLDFRLRLAENIFDDGLASFWIVADSVSTLPSTVLSFSDVSFPICSSFRHGISLLCQRTIP